MKWQLAKFIDPTLSCYGRVVWVEDRPQLWSTKYSVMVDGDHTTGPTEGAGFATNVWGDSDQIPMVAYLDQLELLNEHTEEVRTVWFREWKAMTESDVLKLAIVNKESK